VINNDHNDIFRNLVDNEEKEISDDKSGEELEEDDKNEESRLDWIILIEMRPRANIK